MSSLRMLSFHACRCASACGLIPLSVTRNQIIKRFALLLRTTFLLTSLALSACEKNLELDYSLVMTALQESEAGESVLSAALSADGAYAAFTLIDGSASVWDVSSRKEIRRWPTQLFGGGAEFLEFTGNGTLLLMAGIDHSVAESNLRDGDINYIMIWNILDGSIKRVWTLEGSRLTAVSSSGDGSKIAAGFSNGLIVVFDDSNASKSEYVLHTDKITDVQLSSDGKYALSGSVDSNAHYWDVTTGNILQTFTHKNRVTNIAASSDFSVGFTSDALDSQRLWNLQTGELIVSLQHQQRWIFISDVHFTRTGDQLLIASPSSVISVWDAIDGSNIAHWSRDFPVIDVAQNKMGKLVSVGSTGIVEVWKREQ